MKMMKMISSRLFGPVKQKMGKMALFHIPLIFGFLFFAFICTQSRIG